MTFSSKQIKGGLEEYKGEWSTPQITHLLKRVMFGAKPADVNYFKTKTLSQSVDELLKPQSFPEPPLNYYNTSDYTDPTGIALGATWAFAAYGDGTLNSKRRNSYKAWWLQQMFYQGRSIHEKMILFWHNHFSTEADTVSDARYLYKHHSLLRKFALGNFKTFVREMSIDPAMLVYLNGNKNTKTAPDENYGRELQELFTMGKGSDSKYTEDDVKAAARVLTGYVVSALTIDYSFTPSRHDTSDKTFSSYYNNTVIKGKSGTEGMLELDELVNMLFQKEELSKFICRKIYQFFVHYDLNETVEKNVITPLAEIFRKNKFEITPVLSTLFKSQFFYDTQLYGAVIKSPLDLVIGNLREFDVIFPNPKTEFVDVYTFFVEVVRQGTIMQQSIGDPPNVAGWAAYYQQPIFYEAWITADTYPKRVQYTDTIVANGITRNGKKIQIDVIAFAKNLPKPNDPNLLITDSIALLYKVPVSAERIEQLKRDILLSGQSSDYYWTEIWDTMLVRPQDTMTLVKSKLQSLYQYLLSLPEYQLT